MRFATLAFLVVFPHIASAEETIPAETVDMARACNYFLSDFLERAMEGRPGPKLALLAPAAITRRVKLDRYVEMVWLDVEFAMGKGAGVFAEVASQHRAHFTCSADIVTRRVLYIDITNNNPSGPVYSDLPFESIEVGNLVHSGQY